MSRPTEEARVLDYLREHDGYFTVFWATENQRRACALDRLVKSGRIREDQFERGMGFPTCHAVIVSRVYLSGPMSGLPGLNRPAFDAAAARLRAQGFQVVVPHDLAPERITGETDADYYERCLEADLAELETCQAIYQLPGWQDSRGARREHVRAQELGVRELKGE